jgi:cobalt-zinc-cadmium efflux system outer membrane protein
MYKRINILLICLLCISPSYSKVINQLSFNEALELGLKNNPRLNSEKLGLGINKGNIVTARSRPNPLLISDSGIAENTYRVGISYNFELGGKRKKRTLISESLLKEAEFGLEEKTLNFRQELRTAYTELYFARENLALREELKQSFEKLLSITSRRESLGDLAEVDVLQVKTLKLLNDNIYQESLQLKKEAHLELEYLLNTDLDENIVLEKPYLELNLESKTVDNLIETALSQRPELKQNETAQAIAEQELNLAKAKRIPNLNLTAGPDLVVGSSGQTSAFVIAQIDLPIFNRGKGEIESAKALQEQLTSLKEEEANKIKIEVKKDFSAYLSQKEIIASYKDQLIPTAKEYTEKRFKSFELGKDPMWTALDAQNKYVEIQLKYIELSLKLQNKISSLERSIGVKI